MSRFFFLLIKVYRESSDRHRETIKKILLLLMWTRNVTTRIWISDDSMVEADMTEATAEQEYQPSSSEDSDDSDSEDETDGSEDDSTSMQDGEYGTLTTNWGRDLMILKWMNEGRTRTRTRT